MAFGLPAAIGIGGALLGGIAGGMGKESKQTTTSAVQLNDVDKLNEGEGELATAARESQMGQFGNLESLLTQGGMSQAQGDISAARGEQLTLANMLREAQGGPNEAQMTRAQAFSRDIFAPQEEALRQSFGDAETETSRLAARLGRSVDDPILRAKLASSQADQMASLQARQGAFTAQSAQGFQNQALQMQNQLAQVRGGLATQALQNRQALMGMGQSLLQQERNFRLAQAGRTSTTTQNSGGGLGGAIGGALAGAGAGLGALGKFNSLSGGGGQAAPTGFMGAPTNTGGNPFGSIA